MVIFVSRFPQWLYWVQHLTASISSCGDHATPTQGLVKDVPPAWCIIHAVCRFLQSCSNVKRMTCFGWRLTHDITVHIMGLSLKKNRFEINMKKIPSFAGLVEARESVCKYSFCLSWKPLNTDRAFALRKMPCLSVLMVSTHRPVT